MLISVTERHIKFGLKKNCKACPIALALCDVLSNEYYPLVGTTISIRLGNTTVASMLQPKEVRNFIEKFDNNKYVEPFEFELEIPTQYLRN